MEHDENLGQIPEQGPTGTDPITLPTHRGQIPEQGPTGTDPITLPTHRGGTAAPAIPAAPKKRTPAVKPRSLDELDVLDAKKMTPAESVLYINALREVLLRQKAQGEELNKVAKSSFEQFKNADETLSKIKAQADADIALAKQIMNTAAKSIALIGGQR